MYKHPAPARLCCNTLTSWSSFLLFTWTTITTVWNDVQGKECINLFIGGSHTQPQIAGTYILQPYTYNNRLVYKHPCANYVLFMAQREDGGTTWAIGPHMGSATQYVISGNTSSYPRDVTVWRSWNQMKGAWNTDHRLFVSCSDIKESCKSFTIKGPDVPDHWKGPYDVIRSDNNYTSYKHREDGLFVFHHNDSGCSKWVVGPQLGNLTVLMQTVTDSDTPFDIVEMWTIVVKESRVKQTYNVKVECLADEDSSQLCGKRLQEPPVQPLLLGGSDGYPGKWPYMISYRRSDGIHKCGGAIVASSWVITSGHCVSGADTTNETISVGAYNIDKKEETIYTYRIKATHIHPDFTWAQTPFRLNYDVALIELAGEIIFTNHIQPVCIPAQRDEFPFVDTRPASKRSVNKTYTSCVLAGWGKKKRNGDVGGALQDLPVIQVLNMADCYDTYYASLGQWVRDSRGACVFGQHAGRMCKGDSGSPMFCDHGGEWTLMGLGGWSLSDCAFYFYNYPSVYTDMSVFSDWITAVIYGQTT